MAAGNRKGGDKAAVSVVFWKINTKLKPEDIAKVAAKVMEKGLFPPEGTEILAWYICPGGKGVTITESKGINPAETFRNWMLWVEDMPFFEEYEVLPAISAADAIQMALRKK